MTEYVANERTDELIDQLFTFHPVQGDQGERYAEIRAKAKELAQLVAKLTPPSPEQTLCIRYLHISQMMANSAIAINEVTIE